MVSKRPNDATKYLIGEICPVCGAKAVKDDKADIRLKNLRVVGGLRGLDFRWRYFKAV